jgi:hypothetical protein
MRIACFSSIGMMAWTLAAPAAAQQPLTGEVAVNTLTTGNQFEPGVALRPDGGFVVTWESDGADGDEFGARFRRFTSAGAGVGNEAAVNDVTAFTQRLPAIGTDGTGNFRVVWQTEVVQNDFGVAVRRFAEDGTPSALQSQVNVFTGGFQHNADIAVAADGSFAVVWQDDGQQAASDIFLRTFDTDGDPTSGELVVNQSEGFFRARPAVAMDALGNLVVAWEAEIVGEVHNIYARRFDAAGAPLSDEFRVNATVTGSQKAPDVARRGDGRVPRRLGERWPGWRRSGRLRPTILGPRRRHGAGVPRQSGHGGEPARPVGRPRSRRHRGGRLPSRFARCPRPRLRPRRLHLRRAISGSAIRRPSTAAAPRSPLRQTATSS